MSEWISVKDRLPHENYVRVLVATHAGVICTGSMFMSRCLEKRVWETLYHEYPGRVTHWMPLPEPPKEEM